MILSCSLTMWDVNHDESELLELCKKLFFNYVGCKYKNNNIKL